MQPFIVCSIAATSRPTDGAARIQSLAGTYADARKVCIKCDHPIVEQHIYDPGSVPAGMDVDHRSR